MDENFNIEIVSPEKKLFAEKGKSITIPSFEGEMTILTNHISTITFLRPGIITIKAKAEKKFYVEDGTVEFSNNNLLILTSTARDLVNFNKALINDLLKKAESQLNNTNSTDKDSYVASYKIETLREIS